MYRRSPLFMLRAVCTTYRMAYPDIDSVYATDRLHIGRHCTISASVRVRYHARPNCIFVAPRDADEPPVQPIGQRLGKSNWVGRSSGTTN
jgi:hypothetical protein